MDWIYLSYFLHPEAPAYGGGSAFIEEQDKQISAGDSCNTSNWSMSNHMGTHVDFPRHFSRSGMVLDDYDPGFFVFENIHVVDIAPVKPGLLISVTDLDFPGNGEAVDLLLIKTGWGRFRNQSVYWQKNPGFHPELADHIREKLPRVRMMGFDSISLSSFTSRDMGRIAHRAFLEHEKPVLPLEDMDLSRIDLTSIINRIVVAPLQVRNANGAPCTVFAQVEQDLKNE